MFNVREAGHAVGAELSELHPPERVAGTPTIPDAAVDPLVDAALEFIAETLQPFIDAGSERDVVMEDEKLADAITNQIKSWSTSTLQREVTEDNMP